MMEVDELEAKPLEIKWPKEEVEDNIKKEEIDDKEFTSHSLNESTPTTSATHCKTEPCVNGTDSLNLIKRPVVVLTRLPEYKLSILRPPTPQQFYSEDESLSSSDSDMQWEPGNNSSDSDFSLSNSKQKSPKLSKSNTARSPATPVSSSHSKVAEVKPVPPPLAQSSQDTITRPNLPEKEIKVDMVVLARKRATRWQKGKILDIITKEDGRLKYKVSFEEKGKSLVSGHHIAFTNTPKLEELFIGARVVVQCQETKFSYRPAILAELPGRKNRLRFLVFLDDHTSFYVGLPAIHLVCRPLQDVLSNLPDGPHKSFMKQYLSDWPYPRLTQYKPGYTVNVDLNGVYRCCNVEAVDCSLMQIVFQESQQKEWIYRGSVRLDHVAKFLEQKEKGEPKDDTKS
ncbi:histone-lysine N-methyltransferase SETDB1-B-like [Mugil cephalus]|uniref:histone-lysine N-methyltransferase SETDB1-B-like n=1 Tax=Mugil cephalus TaxID=48193 RepID=UPI001FB71EA7|nr:histone-lysine N-methyltransferase SETDB1-B-like [Mugil cephalus]